MHASADLRIGDVARRLCRQQTLDRIAAGRTVLVVAHRLATVAHSDRIIVLDGGHVSAIGRHEDLLDTSPLYREFATHQLLA